MGSRGTVRHSRGHARESIRRHRRVGRSSSRRGNQLGAANDCSTIRWLSPYHRYAATERFTPRSRLWRCFHLLPHPTFTTAKIQCSSISPVASLYDRAVSLDGTWVLWPVLKIPYTGTPVEWAAGTENDQEQTTIALFFKWF